MELPEKQGLKPVAPAVNCAVPVVAVELPEKQGLKRHFYCHQQGSAIGCSGTSRKTRIETLPYFFTSYIII